MLAEFALSAARAKGLTPIEPSTALERPIGMSNVCFRFAVPLLSDPSDQLADAETRACRFVYKLARPGFRPAFDLYKESDNNDKTISWVITFSAP